MELGCGTHLVVFIPWPPLPGVDGSTRRASRSRAAVVCSRPAMTAGARKGTVQVEEPPPGMDPCHRVGRALPRSRSTVARPAIGGRARQRRGPRRCHHLPRFSHRCWSLTDWPPRFAWSRAVQSRRERGRKIVGARVSGDVVGTGFSSLGINARPSNWNGRTAINGPSNGLGGCATFPA
jgi:hypothetical protein